MKDLMLDNSKIKWHQDILKKWKNGERIYPITIDMALTRVCNFKCEYCFGMLQENKREPINMEVMVKFLDDCSEMGVKAISLVSDGETICNPIYPFVINYGKFKKIDMALGTNGSLFTKKILNQIMPDLTYLRFNISAGEPERYAKIHGVKEEMFHRVKWNILDAVDTKIERGLDCTVGLQMVLKPEYKDDIIPLCELALATKVDYLIIKHCSDDTEGSLGVDYSKYEELYSTLEKAEQMSNDQTKIIIKWNKIKDANIRSYKQCYGPSFHLQISGSGLVSPCGMTFHEKFKKYHIGNFVTERFKDIVNSEKYWKIMEELASDKFDAQKTCSTLCLQHCTNKVLDNHKKGLDDLKLPDVEPPMHLNFI